MKSVLSSPLLGSVRAIEPGLDKLDIIVSQYLPCEYPDGFEGLVELILIHGIGDRFCQTVELTKKPPVRLAGLCIRLGHKR